MDQNNAITCIAAIALTMQIVKIASVTKKLKKNRKIWSKEWLNRRSEGLGVLSMLDNELRMEDSQSYQNFIRLNANQFQHVFSLVENMISKQDTVMRQSVSPRNRLEVTLRFLATGETFRSLMYSTRIHETTISKIVFETCEAIVKVLKPQYLQTPKTAEEWKKIAEDFCKIWQFPLCLGALDGRHITFRAPLSSGSYYHNYKGTNSIVLLGLVDAKYKFTYVNVGTNGRISDGGVYKNSKLSEAISKNSFNFPPPEFLNGIEKKMPYVIVADDAFPLSTRLMKPYSQRNLDAEKKIFNYRLSRARRIVENAFGILANRFRLLLNPINLAVDKVQLLTVTCIILHNFLVEENGVIYSTIEDQPQQMPGVERQSGNRTAEDARKIRDDFKCYFNSEHGSVEWQNSAINNFNS